jgi:hypothetical protein
MIKITAVEDRAGVQVTASDSEGGGFFESAIMVYGAMNEHHDSSVMLGEFLRSLINYIVDEESEWIAGEPAKCEKQERTLVACVDAMSNLDRAVIRDQAIKKAKDFLAEVNNDAK